MPIETAAALMGFAFVMSITPGPSNLLLLASGANFGFARSLPLVFGISFGFLTMVLCVGLGLGQALTAEPRLYLILKIVCAAYIFWLAWKIARSRAVDGDTEIASPITFIQAALLQLLNPKAWTVALIVTVSYTDPSNYVVSLVVLIALFALVNLPSIGVWALSGVALKRILSGGNRLVVFNAAMAGLLIASMAVVLI